jgi:hypothetical protein
MGRSGGPLQLRLAAVTIVISVLTHDGILQASDRRLVWLRSDGSMRLRDDDRNKAVIFGNRIVFAYTGLADLGPERQATDEWLAHTLHDNRDAGDQADILEALAEATTARLNHGRVRSLPRAQRAHEFVGCGWARLPSTQMKEFSPYISLITNMRARDGTLLSEPADHAEMMWSALQPEEPGGVWIVGQQLGAEHHEQLLSDVATAAPNLPAIGSVLIEHIRRAATHNTAIGRGVLLNALPRSAIHPGDAGFMLMIGPPMQSASCFHVSADSTDPCQYGPIVVSPSGGMFAGLTAGPPDALGFPPDQAAGGADQ